MSKTRSGVWRCVGGFAAPIGGQVVSVPDGAIVPADFPYEVMDNRESLFEDVTAPRGERRSPGEVEQATAAPEEKRRRGRPPKSEMTRGPSEA